MNSIDFDVPLWDPNADILQQIASQTLSTITYLTNSNFQLSNAPFSLRLIPTFSREPTAFSTKIKSSTLKKIWFN